MKHVVSYDVTAPYGEPFTFTLTTFSFYCFSTTAEYVITGELKEELEKLVPRTTGISNGALTITNDGTNMKLINNKSTESGNQQATFTFYNYTGGGGGVAPS